MNPKKGQAGRATRGAPRTSRRLREGPPTGETKTPESGNRGTWPVGGGPNRVPRQRVMVCCCWLLFLVVSCYLLLLGVVCYCCLLLFGFMFVFVVVVVLVLVLVLVVVLLLLLVLVVVVVVVVVLVVVVLVAVAVVLVVLVVAVAAVAVASSVAVALAQCCCCCCCLTCLLAAASMPAGCCKSFSSIFFPYALPLASAGVGGLWENHGKSSMNVGYNVVHPCTLW